MELWNVEKYNFDPRPIITSIIYIRRINVTYKQTTKDNNTTWKNQGHS
jgi:hypothetical protein